MDTLNFIITLIAEQKFLDTLELYRIQRVCKEFILPIHILPKICTIPRRWIPKYQIPKHICYMTIGNYTIIFNTKHSSIEGLHD